MKNELCHLRLALLCGALVMGNVSFATAESLCPLKDPLANEADDLRFHESDFTTEKAISSLRYMQESVPRLVDGLLYGPKPSLESFSISYPNGLTIIEGVLLRQEAVLAREQSDFPQKRDRFCSFLAGAARID
jgi:hypothetical protein